MKKISRTVTKKVKKGYQLSKQYIKTLSQYKKFKKLSDNRFELSWKNRNLQLKDATGALPFEPHYTYHPAWAARILAKIKPKKHIDISSIISFGAVASAFIPFEYYDYRPADLKLKNYKSGSADLSNLKFKDNSIESLSCMHTIEHIGLGRYGDPIDPIGDLKAIEELKRVVKPGGDLLIVVPVGKPRIYFNAHRVYSYTQIIKSFKGFKLMDFSAVLDDSSLGLVSKPSAAKINAQKYGCGCFWFRKLK